MYFNTLFFFFFFVTIDLLYMEEIGEKQGKSHIRRRAQKRSVKDLDTLSVRCGRFGNRRNFRPVYTRYINFYIRFAVQTEDNYFPRRLTMRDCQTKRPTVIRIKTKAEALYISETKQWLRRYTNGYEYNKNNQRR